MGFVGMFFIILIIVIVLLILFPKLAKYYDKTQDHFNVDNNIEGEKMNDEDRKN